MDSEPKKIGVFSLFAPNTAAEIVKKLPHLQSRVVDLVHKNGFVTQDISIDNPTLGSLAAKLTGDCDILVGDTDLLGPMMYHLKHIKWVQSTWAGNDLMMNFIDQSKPHPQFELTKFAGTFGQHMAEYVLGHIIATERNFKKIYDSQALPVWDTSIHRASYRLLTELSICILGVGDIGKHVAKICKAFGMKVFGVVSKEIPESKRLACVDKYYFSLEDLPEVLKQSDYVCNTLPKTPTTDDILSNDMLRNCQEKKTVLINIGRGNIVAEKDIVRAVENGWIGGAILDVFKKEPLPTTSKLWGLPNVVITPHCSGLPWASEIADVFIKNLTLLEKGEPLKHLFDWKVGY